jgi:hypothetical protein
MADLGISEFTFGYAFLFEQNNQNWWQLKSFPVFPNLRQEKKWGYDVKLPLKKGTTFYYQFKLSEYMQRNYSKFIRDGTYSGPYYRIKLHKHNSNLQHRTLCNLAQKEPYVYYVAPECSENRIFSKAYLDGNVTEYSRLIPLKNCSNYSPYDQDQHYITYEKGNTAFRQHSDTSEEKESIMGKTLLTHFKKSQKDWKEINIEYAQKILDNVSTILEEYRKYKPILDDLKEPKMGESDNVYSLLSSLAGTLLGSLGIVMVIVGY